MFSKFPKPIHSLWRFSLFCGLFFFFIYLQFGTVFFAGSILIFMHFNTSTKPERLEQRRKEKEQHLNLMSRQARRKELRKKQRRKSHLNSPQKKGVSPQMIMSNTKDDLKEDEFEELEEKSAYSVFNRNHEKLHGELNYEQFEALLRQGRLY